MTIAANDMWDLFTKHRFDSQKIKIPAFQGQDSVNDSVVKTVKREAKLIPLPEVCRDDVNTYSQAEIAKLNLAQKISLALSWSVLPKRYEPENLYKVHSVVPAVRCLVPFDLYLQVKVDGEVISYKYHRNHHALEAISQCDQWGSNSLSIHALIKVGVLADKYGEYSYVPITLGLGGLESQLRQMFTLLELDVDDSSKKINREILAQAHDFELESFSLTLNLDENAKWNLCDDISNSVVLNNTLTSKVDKKFSRLAEFKSHFQIHDGNTPSEKGSCKEISHDLESYFNVISTRSSGNDAIGLIGDGKGLNVDECKRLTKYSNTLNTLKGKNHAEKFIKVNVFSFSDELGNVARFSGGTLDPLNMTRSDLKSMLVNKNIKFNVSSFSGCALICVDMKAALKEIKDDAIRLLHLAAGGLGYELCLAASKMNMFARPLRMMDETVLESMFEAKGKVIYQVIFGRQRRNQFTLEMN